MKEHQHQCGRVGKETVPSRSGESDFVHAPRIKPIGTAWVSWSQECSQQGCQAEEEFSEGGRVFSAY